MKQSVATASAAFTMIRPAILAPAMLTPTMLLAQDTPPPADSAEDTVTAFMTAFSAQDTEAMTAHVLGETVVAVVQKQEGPDRVGFTPMRALIDNLGTIPADVEEPIWNIEAATFGTVAVVSARFDFLIDGNRSHCGTNIFTLMRIDEAWKIATVTYSHETEGCEGPPAE